MKFSVVEYRWESLWGASVALQTLRSSSISLFEKGAFLYKISAASNPARETKGVQSSGDFNGGGVGGVSGEGTPHLDDMVSL
jgi:hypothetical protein